MTTLHLHHSSPLLSTLQGFTITSTLFIAGSMATTSLQFIPGLILATQQREPRNNNKSSKADSGRLTPQPTPGHEKRMELTPAAVLQGKIEESMVSSRGYKLAAEQFSLMSKTAFVTQVPFELLSILASGYLAYRYRSMGMGVWAKWAGVAGLIAAVFPLTGGFMVPVDHKIARLAGVEAAVEPYEDAPPDYEEERDNAEGFLRQWNTYNVVRSAMMLVAGGVGVWSMVE